MSTLNIAGNTAAEVVFASAGADTAPILGTLQTITTDMVILPISGGQWATAKFSVGTGGTATATAQVSIDGGKNFFASAYAKRIDSVAGTNGNGTAGNPLVQAITATTLSTGHLWEVPLPGNCTHFQLLCGGSGTATVVTLSGGAIYVPGVQVVATLYDVTSGVNAANITPTLDHTGWSSQQVLYNSGGATTGAVIIQVVADDGTIPTSGNTIIAATASGYVNMANGSFVNGVSPLYRRSSLNAPAVVAQATRLVVYARRG